MSDNQEDPYLVYCETCDEEYFIPADQEECPICENEVEEVFLIDEDDLPF